MFDILLSFLISLKASPSNVRRNEATEVKRHIKPAAESLVNSSDDQSEDMDTDTKEADLFRHQQKTSQKGIENAQTGSEDGSDASNDEGDPSRLIHESLSRRNTSRSNGQSTKTKYIPQDETPERRNARTIFIGNVPVEVVKGRVRMRASLFIALRYTCSVILNTS